MDKFLIGGLLILGTGAGFINWQGISIIGLGGFFGAVDGVEQVMKNNPANPHPTVKLPPE